METTTAIGSVLAAFGLSGAAGLNPWLPLFVSALLQRLDVVELGAPFDDLSSSGWLAALAVLSRSTSSATRFRSSTTRCTRSGR